MNVTESQWSWEHLLSESEHTQLWRCRDRMGGSDDAVYVAKRFVGRRDTPAFEHFERQATISAVADGQHFLPLRAHWLDGEGPVLLYPWVACKHWQQWWLDQPQTPSLAVRIRLSQELLQALQVIHRMGLVHGNLRSEHVLIDRQGKLKLVGLGACEPVGTITGLQRPPTAWDAPETRDAFEVSSAQDIYAAARLLFDPWGAAFCRSSLAACMLASEPFSRPEAGQLHDLFGELARQYNAGHAYAQAG